MHVGFADSRNVAVIATGKSRTLSWLSTRLPPGTVPDFLTFKATAWLKHESDVLEACHLHFDTNQTLAVRSDAFGEDGLVESKAGTYLSVLDVPAGQLAHAVQRVVTSLPAHIDDQFMVQAMLANVQQAGVASTHRIADGAPWYCVDFASKDSAAVTAGRANGRHVAVARSGIDDIDAMTGLMAPVRQVIQLLRTIELLFDNHPLEVEFATCEVANGQTVVFILQVRPLAALSRWPQPQAVCPRGVGQLAFLTNEDPIHGVVGKCSVLSTMSDWNPAELLGMHPRPLAMSLFQHLISRGAWWHARSSLGYVHAPTPDVELLQVIQGRPFVDVRRSANSFMPAGLDQTVRTRLIDAWIARLECNPELHDKVEFQVFSTVRDFSTTAEIQKALAGVLTNEELSRWRSALERVSRSLTDTSPGAPAAIHRATIQKLSSMDLGTTKRNWTELLELAKEGTFAFSALARIAFATDAQLRTAVFRGAIHPDRAAVMKAAGQSVPTRLHASADLLTNSSHGHLRPGTFDITQKTWAQDAHWQPHRRAVATPSFQFTAAEHRAIKQLLVEAGLLLEPEEWLSAVQVSRRSREWAKYVFSRHLSAAMEDIGACFAASELNVDTASWLTIEQLSKGMALDPRERRSLWESAADAAKTIYHQDQQVMVSPVLSRLQDPRIADSLGTMPNFVGRLAIEGSVVTLANNHPQNDSSLRHSIVVLRQADPGFDWLFDCGIAGLVTASGGANSHMAIRCAEFGLTAAIGCGEAVFAKAQNALRARIDPVGGSLWLA